MKTNYVLEKKIVDNIRALSIDMIRNANSGHPGICLGAAPTIYTLYSRHMNVDPKNPNWINRDRFVMSAGHGSALLYSTLFFCGYDIDLEDLKMFRRINSKTPGHPEYGVTPGVDITTGPLGQGFASAVGMAIAERHYNSIFKNSSLFNYHTYVLCGDGDLMEGISYEAASLAGTLRLGKLIVLYDSNNVSLDGKTELSFTEDVLKRFEAMGWHTQLITDGESVDDIDKAIVKAKNVVDKPSIIEIKTTIGRGSMKQGTNAVHGSPLTEEDISQFKEKNGIRNVPFALSNEAVESFRSIFNERIGDLVDKWSEEEDKLLRGNDEELKNIYSEITKFTIDLTSIVEKFLPDTETNMRDCNASIMDIISEKSHLFIGGSADLSSSTKTVLNKFPVFSSRDYSGRNIYFGVREHCMGAVLNGLALSGLRPFGSTFLVFSDYIKPAIRMSSIMNIPVTYVFTHDNISIGQDGPTHQPVEQLAMLRSIPNFDVYRPCDGNEIIGCWNNILQTNKPSAIVLSRNEVKNLEGSDPKSVSRGAYIVRKEKKVISGIIIATGSEVGIAVEIAERLFKKGIDIRVVSMPCINIFSKQSESYIESLLPIGYKTIVIEFSSSLSWHDFVYNKKYLITLDDFGKSGTKDEIYKDKGFNTDTLTNKIEKILR